ncbi:hypothetical protein [Flaviaesturariibacter amylovorans]|uniref:Uncharacterized protein n=1 Tax=Flaviaesturariibacter amylovorans TaxID=1084520 RepID=A0ABP8H651_9BACT
MCRVSNQIKFCTCAKPDELAQLKSYWVFHSFDQDKGIHMMGRPLFPASIDLKDDAANKKILLVRINEPDAFDMPLSPKERDALIIVFEVPRQKGEYMDHGSFVRYQFQFKAGKWVTHHYKYFEVECTHNEEKWGKVVAEIDWSTFRNRNDNHF